MSEASVLRHCYPRTTDNTPSAVENPSLDDVLILPSISDEEARTRFPNGWEALQPYLRVTPDPRV